MPPEQGIGRITGASSHRLDEVVVASLVHVLTATTRDESVSLPHPLPVLR
jgi:hypothetical protein